MYKRQNSVRARVLQIHRELEIDNKVVTADIIRDRYYGRDKVQYTLLEVYADHNKKCRALIGKEYTESTVTKFETSINRLREFILSLIHILGSKQRQDVVTGSRKFQLHLLSKDQ